MLIIKWLAVETKTKLDADCHDSIDNNRNASLVTGVSAVVQQPVAQLRDVIEGLA